MWTVENSAFVSIWLTNGDEACVTYNVLWTDRVHGKCVFPQGTCIQSWQMRPYYVRNPKVFLPLTTAVRVWGQGGMGCSLPPPCPEPHVGSDLADLETYLAGSPLGVVSS